MTIEQLDDTALRFIGWQCRLRQHAVRRSDGRPSAGMCPKVSLSDGTTLGNIITVLVKKDPANATAQFQHIVKKTNDPLERYEAGVTSLQTVYYQSPREFSDQFTALFGPGNAVAEKLAKEARCTLNFEQATQRFSMPCDVSVAAREDAAYQATYWHNAMFNPRLAEPLTVLVFAPDWAGTIAEID